MINDKIELNNKVFEWFYSARSKNLPVTGLLLKERVLMFAKELGHNGFTESQLGTELNLNENTVINYLNPSKILKYEKRLEGAALQENHKVARVHWAITKLTNREGWAKNG